MPYFAGRCSVVLPGAVVGGGVDVDIDGNAEGPFLDLLGHVGRVGDGAVVAVVRDHDTEAVAHANPFERGGAAQVAGRDAVQDVEGAIDGVAGAEGRWTAAEDPLHL